MKEPNKPYLRHRRKDQPSRHVPGLMVVSLADLLFAKVSAFSTRGFARDLIDLFAVDQQRSIDWQALLSQAARVADNDYNPAEFLRRLPEHQSECWSARYTLELPVNHPPNPAVLDTFLRRLMIANKAVAQAVLKTKVTPP